MSRVGRITGTVALAALALTACSESTATVDGRQDDTRHIHAVTHTEQRAVTSRRCTGTGTERTCRTVTTGHRVVTVTDRPERWCVELDDVNGDRSDDDVWFTVNSSTYRKAVRRDEGDRVTGMPYSRKGC